METEVKVVCPNCETTVDVTQALITRFQESIRQDLKEELSEREQRLHDQRLKNEELARKLNQDRDEIEGKIQRKVRNLVKTREVSLKNEIRLQIQEEKDTELKELERELAKKNKLVTDLNLSQARMERQNQEFEAEKSRIILEKERELSERLSQAKLSISEEIRNESSLKITEKQLVIDSLKKQLQIASQKANQISMQTQGEAGEIVLQQTLRDANPTDRVVEIGQGIRGADCKHIVITQNQVEIGSILYENKITKNWGGDKWIKKIKLDNLQSKCDAMVIVSAVMPPGTEGKYALIDGVWVTSLPNVRDLSIMLRYILVKLYALTMSQSSRLDRKEQLFSYISSESFKNTFEAILEGFSDLQKSHFEERKKIELLWRKRAKLLEEILASTIELYSNVKHIGGSSIAEIKMLEFTSSQAS